MRLYGVRSKEDMLLLYAISQGKLNIPEGAVQNWEQWYGPGWKADFKRGLFNPKRFADEPSKPAWRSRLDSNAFAGVGTFARSVGGTQNRSLGGDTSSGRNGGLLSAIGLGRS